MKDTAMLAHLLLYGGWSEVRWGPVIEYSGLDVPASLQLSAHGRTDTQVLVTKSTPETLIKLGQCHLAESIFLAGRCH